MKCVYIIDFAFYINNFAFTNSFPFDDSYLHLNINNSDQTRV